MKKISVLLFSLFLSLPIFIYFGNLADLPISRSVIIHLRDLVGMSAHQKTDKPAKQSIEKITASHAPIGLIEAWRNLAMLGINEVLKISATAGVNQAWQTSSNDFLTHPLFATAFFSSSWSFWQIQQDKLSLVAYYQPWIDMLLIMQVSQTNGAYEITAVGITEPSNPLSTTDTATTVQELNKRLEKAEQTFQHIAQHPNELNVMLSPALLKKSQTLLQQYVNDVRNKLSTDQSKNCRLAILEWLDAAKTGQIKELQDILETDRDWLKHLQIVQLTKLDADHWLLSATNPQQTERILIAQLKITEHKAQTKELQIWDAAMSGVLK